MRKHLFLLEPALCLGSLGIAEFGLVNLRRGQRRLGTIVIGSGREVTGGGVERVLNPDMVVTKITLI
jgi:hypothetical protein